MHFDLLSRDAHHLEHRSLDGLNSSSQWPAWSSLRRAQWREMLGIDDAWLQCDLDARITQAHQLADVTLEALHFQAVPGKRIPCNLWLPAVPGPHPCIIYLCGHGMPGKACYQNHGRWFAQQGYACLVVDAIQIGESEGLHHGLFFHDDTHWVSQGYTPAGVEVQVARRALDYLATRSECDASRCGLTGISGGATMSLFTAAADTRFAAVAPHCIAGTLDQVIGQRSLDTHCDCTTWVNRHRFGLTQIAALVAPRPLLLSFSTLDGLCTPQPMRDLAARLMPVWRMLGSESLAASEDEIPHAYSALICKRILSWFNVHLKGMASQVEDDAVLPFLTRCGEDYTGNLPVHMLSAFETHDPPMQQRMADVDRSFIRLPGRPAMPADTQTWNDHCQLQRDKLRTITFRHLPSTWSQQPTAITQLSGQRIRHVHFTSDDGAALGMIVAGPTQGYPAPATFLVGACDPNVSRTRNAGAMGTSLLNPELGLATVHVRGSSVDALGPNFKWFAMRAYPLLGKSLPERQAMDLLLALGWLIEDQHVQKIALYGKKDMSSQAIYAAILCPQVTELVLEAPATTHWRSGPEYPGILQVGDLPANLAMFFPRPITFVGAIPSAYDWVMRLYQALGHSHAIRTIPAASMWSPLQPVDAPTPADP